MTEPNKVILPTPSTPPAKSRADKVILFGAGGTGKSVSIATTLANAPADRRIIYLMTDPNAAQGLEWGLQHYKIKLEEGQLIYLSPRKKGKSFSNVNRALGSYMAQSKADALKGNAQVNPNKDKYTYLTAILNSLENFKGNDYLTDEEVAIGNVGDLDSSDILVIDGLSPISHEVWKSTAGDKIAIGMNDYMPAQQLMYDIMAELAVLECPVILLAHETQKYEEKQDNFGKTFQVLKGTFVDTGVGVSNYQRLMGCWTDVIRTYKEGVTFKWEASKGKEMAQTVSRTVPAASSLEPNFNKYGFFYR